MCCRNWQMGKWIHLPAVHSAFRESFRTHRLCHFTLNLLPTSGSWQDGIPYWEKKYCTLVGSIPWWKVVDAKNYLYGNSVVLNWNDSAAEATFQNAKKGFWADINGLPCNAPPPNPNTYIDTIDWS